MDGGTTLSARLSGQRSFMRYQKCLIIPSLLFTANLAPAVTYLVAGDWRRAAYWAASSVCIASVTF